MEHVDGILFDLDGTLWDAVAGICTAWNRGLEKCGVPLRFTEGEIRGCMGMLLEDIADKLMPGLRINRGERFGSCMELTLDDARAIYLSAL